MSDKIDQLLLKVPQITLMFWVIKIAATTLGETGGDALSMSLGLGYLLSTGIFAGSISPHSILSKQSEIFYWLTITFSQTLGTALGDWTADSAGLGYVGGIMVFAGLMILIILAHFYTKNSSTWLFWLAFVLTRPLGAVVGDFLDKPLASGGLDLSRFTASLILLIFIAVCIYFYRQDGRQLSSSSSSRPMP